MPQSGTRRRPAGDLLHVRTALDEDIVHGAVLLRPQAKECDLVSTGKLNEELRSGSSTMSGIEPRWEGGTDQEPHMFIVAAARPSPMKGPRSSTSFA
jgi:hypothetical protein